VPGGVLAAPVEQLLRVISTTAAPTGQPTSTAVTGLPEGVAASLETDATGVILVVGAVP